MDLRYTILSFDKPAAKYLTHTHIHAILTGIHPLMRKEKAMFGRKNTTKFNNWDITGTIILIQQSFADWITVVIQESRTLKEHTVYISNRNFLGIKRFRTDWDRFDNWYGFSTNTPIKGAVTLKIERITEDNMVIDKVVGWQ